MKKRILNILTTLALIIVLLPAATVPASAASTSYTVSNSDEFHRALINAKDGDTIQVDGFFVVKNSVSNNDSLVIDKSVTIRGGGLTFWYAGILLGSDVTFEDITIGLGSNVRPAIMANGHTLTLRNVQREAGTRHIHLFCGGQTGVTQGALSAAKQGNHGKILLEGNTNLGLTNIYAGSISTDGENNAFAKPATVTIAETVKGQSIEHVYACGALQTYTSENDWFDYEHEINPPFASPGNFKVSGNVTFNLYGTAAKRVSGDTGVLGNLAQVNYKGNSYLNDGLLLSSIGGLTVESGSLAPAAGQLVQKNESTADRTSEIVPVSDSSFFGSNAPLTIAGGATLDLQNLGSAVTVGNFTGGGSLVLGQSQTLTATGPVSGTTTVGIGGIFNGHSQEIPIVGSTYIEAINSTVDDFALAAYASRPDIKLVKSENGAWTATEDANIVIVKDFQLASAVVESSSEPDAELPSLAFQNVDASDSSSTFVFSNIDLIISVGGQKTEMVDDGYGDSVLSTDTLWLSVTDNGHGSGEVLQISGKNYAQPPAGTYVISVTVPATNSGTGQSIIRIATLTVKAADGNTVISAPTPVNGLVYNGKEQVGVPLNAAYTVTDGQCAATDAGTYTVYLKPAEGFTWSDGQTTEVRYTWYIDKADNPNPLPRLSAVAPSAYGKSDGKITGTTVEMEYFTDESFTSPTACTVTETAGLAAGDYYVRYKGDNNYNPGMAIPVTVPQGSVTVTSIDIATPAVKTTYKVGEPLDVTGLTLTATMSDNSTHTVPVSAHMVSGFSSSAAAQSKTLIITYSGKTTTYTVSITEDGSAGSGGGSTGGGSIGGGGSTGGGDSSFPVKDKETEEEEKPANVPVYNDISANAWYNDAVSFVTEKGLMSGTGTNTFAPDDHLTRAMLAQILYNNEENPATNGNAFTDVQSSAWYADAVSWAARKGIVSGYGNGQFGPDDSITRQQLAVMLWKYAGEPASNAGLDSFTDIDKASHYALTALRWAVEKGIISGKGNGILDPAGNATRAEVAQMLMNYFKHK